MLEGEWNTTDYLNLFGSPNVSYYNTTNSTSILQHWNKRHAIGVSLAVGGNLLISVSLSVQKKAHNRLGHESRWGYCIDKWWWLGMLLMAFGEVGNFLAYGFAPASMVAPLGSVAVLSNAFIAVIFLREPLTLPSIMGVTIVIVGAITLVSFSAKVQATLTSAKVIQYLGAWPFLLYLGVEAVILGVLLYLKYGRKNEHMVVLLLLVGVIASITIISAKALSSLISESILLGHQQVLNPIFWVCLILLPITTATQIRFLNRAMQLYDVSDVVPVNFIFFTVSAILAGAMFYQEFNGVQFDRIFLFFFGCVLSFVGVYIIAHQKEYKTSSIEEERKRTSTNDSGLASGSSASVASSCSFNSTDLVSVSDEEAPSSGKDVEKTNPPKGVSEHSNLIAHNFTCPPSTSYTVTDSPKQFARDLKSTETIHKIQPEPSDESDY